MTTKRAVESWWRSRLPDISAALSRFPLAVLIAALLTVSLRNGASVKFDIADAMTEVYRRGWPKVDDHHPIELKGMPNGLDGTVVIDNMNGTYMEPDLDISLLRFWLILSKSG